MSNEQSSRHFSLQELTDGVFAAIAKNGGSAIANAGIIDLGDTTVIFDTCLTLQAACDLRSAAERLTGRAPAIVINSHYHNDHMWGNQAFAPHAQFIASARTRQLIEETDGDDLDGYRANAAPKLESLRQQYGAADSAASGLDVVGSLLYCPGPAVQKR